MDLETLTAIRQELESELVGRRIGKIFQLSKTNIAVDFNSPDSHYLFLSVEPKNPRTYLIRRKLRDLEKASGQPTTFSLILRKQLSGSVLTSIGQLGDERVLLFAFISKDDIRRDENSTVVAQLTGASANLFLLDPQRRISASLRKTLGTGQQPGETYQPPAKTATERVRPRLASGRPGKENLSAHLDTEDRTLSAKADFLSLVNSARSQIKQETSKRERLLRKLSDDLAGHGDADKWRRFGDILLANTTSARRDAEKVFVTDYFNAEAPEIAIIIDENDSITEAAEKFFKRYAKARNAGQEIEKRRRIIGKELKRLASDREELETAIEAGDRDSIAKIAGIVQKEKTQKSRRKRAESMPGVRRFVSSDGFEILVGKKAKDNDFLTFRIAKSLDTWMHAADYPGSHVVIRNPNRKDMPHKTLVEAAQLAAFYSQGKSQPKAAVHYSQKKFVNKPKGSAAGLVSLASFKTLLVEPKVGEAKIVTSDK